MNRSHEMTTVFSLAAAVLAAAVIILSFSCWNASPALLRSTGETAAVVSRMMDTVAEGNFSEAGSFFYGEPDFSQVFPDEKTILPKVTQALWDSFQYTVDDKCRADGTTLAVDVTVSSLDAGRVLSSLDDNIQAVLEERKAAVTDFGSFYNLDGTVMDSVMEEIVDYALDISIAEAPKTDASLVVHLGFDNGQWKILPEAPLLTALTGHITVNE